MQLIKLDKTGFFSFYNSTNFDYYQQTINYKNNWSLYMRTNVDIFYSILHALANLPLTPHLPQARTKAQVDIGQRLNTDRSSLTSDVTQSFFNEISDAVANSAIHTFDFCFASAMIFFEHDANKLIYNGKERLKMFHPDRLQQQWQRASFMMTHNILTPLFAIIRTMHELLNTYLYTCDYCSKIANIPELIEHFQITHSAYLDDSSLQKCKFIQIDGFRCLKLFFRDATHSAPNYCREHQVMGVLMTQHAPGPSVPVAAPPRGFQHDYAPYPISRPSKPQQKFECAEADCTKEATFIYQAHRFCDFHNSTLLRRGASRMFYPCVFGTGCTKISSSPNKCCYKHRPIR